MRKSLVLQPKFDIGDVLAYQYTKTEERGDDVPVQKTVKNAGRADGVRITQNEPSKGQVEYLIGGEYISEAHCKKVNI